MPTPAGSGRRDRGPAAESADPEEPGEPAADAARHRPTSAGAASAPADGDTTPTPYADRVYRSVPAIVGGIVLLALALWMLVATALDSSLYTSLTTAAGVVTVTPPIIAFTLRPVVRANDDRMLIRNPFRTVHVPWSEVAEFRAVYSTEVRTTGGVTYQVWAIPVSVRGRKRALRRAGQQSPADQRGQRGKDPALAGQDPGRSATDNNVAVLRELARRNADRPAARGQVRVWWASWSAAPFAVGLLAFVLLLALG